MGRVICVGVVGASVETNSLESIFIVYTAVGNTDLAYDLGIVIGRT